MTSCAAFPYVFQNFVKIPNIENAQRVSECLTEDAVRQICLMGKQDFVLTSILTVISELDVRNKNEIFTHLIEAATRFISHSRIKKLVSMKTMLVILLKQIGTSPTFVTTKPNLSEEFKLATMKCFTMVFRRILSEVIEEFYCKENLNLIAHIVSISQHVIANETYRPLRIAGIECTLSVFQLHDEADHNDIVLRKQVADLVFILLPKIFSTLKNVATGDETLGETLIVTSIDALGRVLCLVFEEQDGSSGSSIIKETKILIENSLKNIAENPQNLDVLKLPKKSSSIDENLKAIQSKQRNSDWLCAASLKILPMIQLLHKLTGSKSHKIRQALYELSDILLRRCQKHLASCISALLEINITLYDDGINNSAFIYNENIVDMAEKLFVDHLIRLIRIAHTGDEDEQMANLRLLRGFIFMLCKANRLKITLANENTLEKFISILLSMVELERPTKLLDENNNIYDLSEKKANNVQSLVRLRENSPWKVYKNLRNAQLIGEIGAICQRLGENDPVNVFMLEYLLKLLTVNSVKCNEVLIIIQLMTNTVGGDHMGESIHIAILEELLSDFRWSLATEISEKPNDNSVNRTWFEDHVDGLYESAITISLSDIQHSTTDHEYEMITIKDIKNNILHMCLTIETVGLYAKQFGQKFQTYMLRSFHRILEKSASVHYVIRISALIALNNVKEAFQMKSISELIFINADYITYSINISLKRPDQIDIALRMLSIVLHYNSVESMPHLENIIETILSESTKFNQSNNILSFIKAFHLILITIRDSIVNELKFHSTELLKKAETTNYFDVWKSILTDPKEEIEEIENEPEEDVDNEQPMETDESSEQEVQKPTLVKLSINIIKRSIPYFASKDQDIKLSAMDCLTVGLDILKDYEDDLLPIVHLIWDPFVSQCVRDTSSVVLRYCIRLLAKLALYAKDFIYKRSADQLFPHINSHMHALSKKSISEKQQFLYEHTQEFKLIQELLINLPDILKSLNVQEKEFDNILNAVVWLLDANQPQSLQIHCVNLMKECAAFDVSTIYVKLLKYHSNDRYKINYKKIFPNDCP